MTVRKPLEARFGNIEMPERVKPGEFTRIPIVDLTDLSNPSPEARERLAQQIYNVATTVGFFYITNHGIPQDLIDQAHEMARQYFALPHSIKMEQFAGKRCNEFIGYVPPLDAMPPYAQEHLRVAGGKRVEAFAMGYEIAADSQKTQDNRMPVDQYGLYGPNEWPEGQVLGEFRTTLLRYYAEMLEFSRKLIQIFALALDLEADHFDEHLNYPGAMCRLMHYLASKPSDKQEASAIGPHTDIGFFTILSQGAVPGLQVLNARKEWIAVPIIPGALVVNIGDCLHYWYAYSIVIQFNGLILASSNGIFRSTPHRAINLTGDERYSIPFFFNPDYTVTTQVADKFVTKERPAITEPFIFGEWVNKLMKGANSDAS
ncbi:2OG-Fe(II) oxygenase family oxidoreductase, putative [Aspergillus udagawae]|nr:2OG-Fe(II) oxygenase family oxidoreductase, putative [Aspergillus udagawae]